jgi:hypothetical protein
MSSFTDGIEFTTDEDKAVYHVFVNLIGLDQDSYSQVNNWFKYQGISSLNQLLDLYMFSPSTVLHTKYRVNGQTQYLDSWITDNFSSICHYAIDTIRQHKVPTKAKEWLNLKSINDCQKFGLKLHHPPKTVSKPIAPVDEAHSFSTRNSPFMEDRKSSKLSIPVHPIPVIKITPAATFSNASTIRAPCNRDITNNRAVNRDSNIHPPKEASKKSNAAYNTQARSIPPGSNNSHRDHAIHKVTNVKTQNPIKATKPTITNSVPAFRIPPTSISSSVTTPGHTIPDPSLMTATTPKEDPKTLPAGSPSKRYSTPATTSARKRRDAALTRTQKRPSYKGVLTTLLASNATNPSTSQETLPFIPLPPSTNGECIATPESVQTEDTDTDSDQTADLTANCDTPLTKPLLVKHANSTNELNTSLPCSTSPASIIANECSIPTPGYTDTGDHICHHTKKDSNAPTPDPPANFTTCIHHNASMLLPPTPTEVSLGSDPGECHSDLHHQVHPYAHFVSHKNKWEPSGNAMSSSKPGSPFVTSKTISLDIHKADNTTGELWGAVTSVSTTSIPSTDKYIKKTSLEILKIMHAILQELGHNLRQKSHQVFPTLEERIDSHHDTTSIVPTNKKTINPGKKLLDLLSSSRVLIRFLSQSPRHKTSFTIKLNLVIDPKGLVSEKNLLLYPQILAGSEPHPGVYDPSNPLLYQAPGENALITIHKREPKQEYCLQKEI